MKALEIGNVKITSGFWKEYQELILKNRQFSHCTNLLP